MAPTAQREGSPRQLSPTDTRIALQSFANLASAWGLTTDEQINLLGSPPRSTFFKWRKEGGALSKDTQDRLSHVFSIFKALEILFPSAEDADHWMREPNKTFGGRTALEHALLGFGELIEVRRYLDAQRG
jgi:uncharacterized protein (DUF2384 family)